MAGWGDFGKEAARWLVGGGALAIATSAGTWVYQQKQLEIERERNLREFLHRYVDIATHGTFDERLRFVQYWASLDVADEIGVDFRAYHKALRQEITAAQATERANVETRTDWTPPDDEPTPDDGAQPVIEPEAVVVAPPPEEAFWSSRAATVAALDPATASAPEAERAGFDALLARDHAAALAAFRRAENAWPDYHNVAEIRRLLERARPTSDAEWRRLYAKILADYVWGMPDDQRRAMRDALSG
jgi:hypothetical protein